MLPTVDNKSHLNIENAPKKLLTNLNTFGYTTGTVGTFF